MPLVLQNIFVLAAVGGCVVFLFRGVFRALHGRKSRLSGCGVCSGCPTPTATPKANPTTVRIVMVPMDSLIRSHKAKVDARSN
jgi:hypothetical protein